MRLEERLAASVRAKEAAEERLEKEKTVVLVSFGDLKNVCMFLPRILCFSVGKTCVIIYQFYCLVTLMCG